LNQQPKKLTERGAKRKSKKLVLTGRGPKK